MGGGSSRRSLCHRLLVVGVSRFSSSSHQASPSFFSFLQPSIFSLKNPDSCNPRLPPPPTQTSTLTLTERSELEETLRSSIAGSDTGEAWRSFKSLISGSGFPPKHLANALIVHLSSLGGSHSLKRAFASSVFLLEKNTSLLEFESVTLLLEAFHRASLSAPAFSLVRRMLQNRYFMPFGLWGPLLAEISRRGGALPEFLQIFNEVRRLVVDEKLDHVSPDLPACNCALEACCRTLESVRDAENVLEAMSVFGLRPDPTSCALLAYLYAAKGLHPHMSELDTLMAGLGYPKTPAFFGSLIEGYSKSGDRDSLRGTVLSAVKEGVVFSEQMYSSLVGGVLACGGVRDLARLTVDAERMQAGAGKPEETVGFGIVAACRPETAHNLLEEVLALAEGGVGLGVYLPVLRTYCREGRTAEAAQLVAEMTGSGLELEGGGYEAVIEASMSSGDFVSAFSVFRDMRGAAAGRDLKGGYLAIMAGLTESRRPELMAAFLDEAAGDPRVEVGVHDWNSVVHAFCKAGRLEDAKRTRRRMAALLYEPDDQTDLSLVNGNMAAGKYFEVLRLWNDVKRRASDQAMEAAGGGGGGRRAPLGHGLLDALLVGLVKGGFFEAVMEVVQMAEETKVFVDKWRYRQAFMESHKKLNLSKGKRRVPRKKYAFSAFKKWVGLAD